MSQPQRKHGRSHANLPNPTSHPTDSFLPRDLKTLRPSSPLLHRQPQHRNCPPMSISEDVTDYETEDGGDASDISTDIEGELTDRFREGSLGPQQSGQGHRDPRRISTGDSKENYDLGPDSRRDYNEQQWNRKIGVMKRGEVNSKVARIFGFGSFVNKDSTLGSSPSEEDDQDEEDIETPSRKRQRRTPSEAPWLRTPESRAQTIFDQSQFQTPTRNRTPTNFMTPQPTVSDGGFGFDGDVTPRQPPQQRALQQGRLFQSPFQPALESPFRKIHNDNFESPLRQSRQNIFETPLRNSQHATFGTPGDVTPQQQIQQRPSQNSGMFNSPYELPAQPTQASPFVNDSDVKIKKEPQSQPSLRNEFAETKARLESLMIEQIKNAFTGKLRAPTTSVMSSSPYPSSPALSQSSQSFRPEQPLSWHSLNTLIDYYKDLERKLQASALSFYNTYTRLLQCEGMDNAENLKTNTAIFVIRSGWEQLLGYPEKCGEALRANSRGKWESLLADLDSMTKAINKTLRTLSGFGGEAEEF